MGGLEAATALHYMMPDVPVFLLTAHYSRELELTALQCGVRAIFSKYDDLGRLLHRARAELRIEPTKRSSGVPEITMPESDLR
jgi:DNA-binding NarL/FixJ family response regulator